MLKIARASLLAVAGAILLSGSAAAAGSRSASYTNSRSSPDAGGRRKSSASYRADASVGGISANGGASPSFTKRDGLEGDDFYPGRINDLWGSSTPVAGGAYLQWTAPGNDGYENSTVRTYIVKYSSVAADSPALSDANFNAAPALASPPPAVQGTLQTATYALAPGVTYYFAVKAVEGDGLRGILSNGATVYTNTLTGCAVVRDVSQGAGPYFTIQSAVNSLPNPLAGYSCVIVHDSATYPEQVDVRNFLNNGASITITASMFTGAKPVVAPPAGSTAAFRIAQASVSVMGLTVAPSAPVAYGVAASSGYVLLSSMTVSDAAGRITTAGISISSYSAVWYSSVTTLSADGMDLIGAAQSVVGFSSATVLGAAPNGALVLIGASASTVRDCAFSLTAAGAGGFGPNALVLSASSGNTILRSSATQANWSGHSALILANGSGANAVTGGYFWSGAGFGGTLGGAPGNNANVFSQTTFGSDASAGAAFAIQSGAGSSNVFAADFFFATGAGAFGFANLGGTANAVSLSTVVVSGNASRGLYEQGVSSGSRYTGDYVFASGSSSYGADFAASAGFGYTAVSGSAIRAAGANSVAVMMAGSSSSTVAGSGLAATGVGSNAYAEAGPSAGNGVFTSTLTSLQGTAVLLAGSYAPSLVASYIQGSTAVFVSGSTNAYISGSYLSAAQPGGDALYFGGAGANLTVVNSTMSGGSAAKAVHVDAGNQGTITLSSDVVMGSPDGIYVGTQAAGTNVFIVSDLILPLVGATADSHGLAFDGLTSGATVQYTSVYYRAPAAAGANSVYALWARGASGVVVDHSRINNPGMVTSGSFGAVALLGATNVTLAYDDVASFGAGLNAHVMLSAAAGSAGLRVRNCVFSSSASFVAGSSATLSVDAASQAGFAADYNDYFSTGVLVAAWGGAAVAGLSGWQAASGQDADSVSGNPLWWSVAPGAEDFHPMSVGGRWSPAAGAFIADAILSPTVDAGDPGDPFGNEPPPNGARANEGSYGDTVEASKSPPPPSSVAIFAAWLSSGAVKFGGVGADGYVVQGSTDPLFRGVVFSSGTRGYASPLADSGLNPNTTYYFRAGALWNQTTVYAATVVSSSTLALPATGYAFFEVDLTSAVITWVPLPSAPPAPSSGTAEGYVIQASTAADFTGRISTAASASVLASSAALLGLVPSTTYFFRVGTVNWDGGVDYGAVAATMTATPPVIRLAQAPYGVAISSAGGGVALRWMPVVRYADGGAFLVSTAPTGRELSAYHVMRSTTPLLAAWTDVATLSTAAWTYTDMTGGPAYYYQIQAENSSGLSHFSVVRTLSTRSAYVVAPDLQSYFEILSPNVYPVEGTAGSPYSAYLVEASSRPQDLGGMNGRIVKSVEFDAWQGGQLLAPDYAFGGMGVLHLHYEVGGSSGLAPSFNGAAKTPDNMSVYWYNGSSWVQLFGTLDAVSQTMTIQTKYLGPYQLRTVERTGGFAFNQAGVSNRFVTPNGDGKNDNVVFTYDNPRNASVTGSIIDARGKTIVASLPPGPTGNSFMWDGTAGGVPVAGGVYVYKIKSDGQVFTGTLVLVK